MTVLTVRKMGNSLGFTVPSDEAKRLDLHPGDQVDVEFRKPVGIEAIFGLFKGQFGDIDHLMKEMDAEDAEAEARDDAEIEAMRSNLAKRAKKARRDS